MDKDVGLSFLFSGYQLSDHIEAMREQLERHGLAVARPWRASLAHFVGREDAEPAHYHIFKNSEFAFTHLICSKPRESLIVASRSDNMEGFLAHHGLRPGGELCIAGSVYEREDLRVYIGKLSRRESHSRKAVLIMELRGVRAFSNHQKPFRIYIKDYFDLLFPDLRLKAEFEPAVERNWACLQEAIAHCGLSDSCYSEKHFCYLAFRLAGS